MSPLSSRWRAAGFAALFVLVTWACNCGTFQQLASPAAEVADTPTPLPLPTEAPTLAPPTEMPTATLTAAPAATPTEAPTATPARGPVLFEDDFSVNSGWYVDQDEVGSYRVENGVYAITAQMTDTQLWGNAGRSFGDVVIDIDATQISGPPNDNSGYGVGCRVQENGDGYFLRLTANGDYAIVRYTSSDDPDASGFIPLIDWTPTDAINQGKNTTNHITAICQGSSISLSVNGVLLGTAQDGTYPTGDIAVTATTFEAEPVTVHFDNLVVSEP